MSRRLPGQEFEDCFFVTTGFLDRRRLGEVEGVYEGLTENLVYYCNREKAKILGYVFMPSHIHLLLLVDGGRLAKLVRDFKKRTTQKVLSNLIGPGPQWEQRYDRVAIWTLEVLQGKLNYIHDNPVRAGLVEKQEEWKWSSAADYILDRVGPVPVWKEWW